MNKFVKIHFCKYDINKNRMIVYIIYIIVLPNLHNLQFNKWQFYIFCRKYHLKDFYTKHLMSINERNSRKKYAYRLLI